jgi:hypothetical protein
VKRLEHRKELGLMKVQIEALLGLVCLACALRLGAASTYPGGRALLSESDHRWKLGDEIHLYANKIGPLHNPRCAGLAT